MPETTYLGAITADARGGDARRPARARARRGRRRGRALGRDRRPGRRVRLGARPEHPDQRGGDRGHRDRRRAVGAAPGGRDHVRRLRHARPRPAGQPGGEGPLHVRRPADRADGPAHAGRCRAARRRPALAEPRGLADARPRLEGGHAGDRRRRGRAPPGGDRRPEPGRLCREQDALLPARGDADRRTCRSVAPRSSARAATSPSSRCHGSSTSRSPQPTSSPPTESRSR